MSVNPGWQAGTIVNIKIFRFSERDPEKAFIYRVFLVVPAHWVRPGDAHTVRFTGARHGADRVRTQCAVEVENRKAQRNNGVEDDGSETS
jgi:hypothetical protein